MNFRFLPLFLAGTLALSSCGKKSDDPQAQAADPFLGHWVADSMHEVEYDAQGQAMSGHDSVYRETYWMEVSPTTFIDQHPAAIPYTTTRVYTRSGAVLTVASAKPDQRYEVRNLTPASFTYVVTQRVYTSATNVITMEFHR